MNPMGKPTLSDRSANLQPYWPKPPLKGEVETDLNARIRLAAECIEEYRRLTASYEEANTSNQEEMARAGEILENCVHTIERLDNEVRRLKNERTLLGLLGDAVTYVTESIFFFLWGVCVASVQSARQLPRRIKHIVTTAVIIGISFLVRLWDRIMRIYATTLRIGRRLATRVSIRLSGRHVSTLPS